MNSRQLTNHLTNKILAMEVESNPFVTFKIRNFLPSEIFHTLRSSFPSLILASEKASSIYHNRGGINLPDIDRFNASSISEDQKILWELIQFEPAWGKLISYLGSRDFLLALKKRLIRHLARERGLRMFLPWEYSADNKSQSVFDWHVQVSNHLDLFSMVSDGVVHPHKDANRKLMTLLLYFADDDWQGEWGGDTLFFRSRSKTAEKEWRRIAWNWKNHIPVENRKEFYRLFEVCKRGEYRPNMLAGFCPNVRSYHAVERISVNGNRQRNAISININIRKKR